MENIGSHNTENTRFMQFMFKPTYACNLACKYCHVYQLRDTDSAIISFDMAKSLFDWILDYCIKKRISHIDILWHGGEPLLVKPVLMYKIISYYLHIFRDNNIVCSSSIQSNLLLLSSEYIPIIKEYFDNTIGFSYDYRSDERCYANGKDASYSIWDKALWAKSQGINLGVITQLNNNNINHIDDLYHWFRNADMSFKYSRIRSTDRYSRELNDDVYINSLKRLFDLWINDDSQRINILNFRELIQMLITGKSSSCCYQNDCNILSFTNKGEIYFCDRFQEKGLVGVYTKNSVDDVVRNIYSNIKSYVETENVMCDSCKYSRLCNGGCLFNRISGYQKHECYVTKSLLTYIEEFLLKQGYDVITK